MAEANKVLDIYYDHYKDTNTLNKEVQYQRNRSFVTICILEALSFLMTKNPDLICGLLNDVSRKELETTIQFSNSIIQTLLWILIAYALMRYVQEVLYVERQYDYLKGLEKKIAELIGEADVENIFSREGQFYQKDYPMALNFTDLFYKMFAPLLFSVINVVRIITEWHSGESTFALCCDTAICACVMIITCFYFFYIHRKVASWFMKCAPIRVVVNFLQNCLREV